jgi:hypothetical protein
VLGFDLDIVNKHKPLEIILDNQRLEGLSFKKEDDKIWLSHYGGKWNAASKPTASEKNPNRYGTFKDAVNHNVVFVYGTSGDQKENDWAFQKARYDAEQFWYQGNGSIEVVADNDFNASAELNRNVILYGNAETNLAWKKLLSNSPVQVHRGKIKIGNKEYNGNDIGGLFIRPRSGSDIACVAAVTGTGIHGMNLTNRRLYLNPGYPFPDLMFFNKEFTSKGIDGVIAAGFFGINWSVDKGEIILK